MEGCLSYSTPYLLSHSFCLLKYISLKSKAKDNNNHLLSLVIFNISQYIWRMCISVYYKNNVEY